MKPLLASLTVLAILAGAGSASAGKKGKERRNQERAAALAEGKDAPTIEPAFQAELRPKQARGAEDVEPEVGIDRRIVGDIALHGEIPGRVEVWLDAIALHGPNGLKLRLQPRVQVADRLLPGPGEIPHLWVRIPVGVSDAWSKRRVIEHTFRLDEGGKDHLASLDHAWLEHGRIRLIETSDAAEAAYFVRNEHGDTVKSAQKGTDEDPNVRLRPRTSE